MAVVAFEKNMEKVMSDIAEEAIFYMERELRVSKKIASGSLIDSFQYTIEDNKLRIFSTEKHAGAVDFGRGPTESGGDGDLFFAIEKWMMDKNIRPRKKDKNGNVIGFAPLRGGSYLRASAYAITQKIHKVGYRGINYSKYAMDKIKDKAGNKMQAVYLDEIERKIKTNFLRKVGAGEFTTIKVQ